MFINQSQNDATVKFDVEGRLDTTTAPQLEEAVKQGAKNKKTMIMDLSKVEYVSSSGLRVILLAHKIMAATKGKLIIQHPSEFCMQVFIATGMDSILSISV
ncbi:MAG: STAS domain-containing protein [Treponema sp.]|nr:STAS domain-containing protein [Treponema sp.]